MNDCLKWTFVDNVYYCIPHMELDVKILIKIPHWVQLTNEFIYFIQIIKWHSFIHSFIHARDFILLHSKLKL
jgi:hypothetical protein